MQLAWLFDHQNNRGSKLAAEQCHLHVRIVFVAVANDQRFAVFVHGQNRHELGFGAGFEAVVKRATKVDNLFDHRARLIHLNGKDTAVARLVSAVGDGLRKGAIEFFDASSQYVGEAQKNRSVVATGAEIFDHFEEICCGD